MGRNNRVIAGVILLLSSHARGHNASNNFALEDGVEDKDRRRGNKGSRKGETALNVTTLLDYNQSNWRVSIASWTSLLCYYICIVLTMRFAC